MSDDEDADEPGDAEAGDEASDAERDEAAALDPETLGDRLDDIETALEAAETEADLDAVEADLDAVAEDVEALPDTEDDGDDEGDEDEPDPKAELGDRVAELRDGIEEARGPYAEDVTDELVDAEESIRETRWTDDGLADVRTAVETFLETVDAELDVSIETGNDADALAGALARAGDAVEDAALDPDDDAATLEALFEATGALAEAVDGAEEYDDLTVREQLEFEGFFDVLTSENRKDFPPELGVVRIAEATNDPDRILLGLEKFDSEFMEENCIDALRRLAPPEAVDPMLERAQRRDKPAIEVLGNVGDPAALDTLLEFIEGDADPDLQRVTLKAIGRIGEDSATQAVADRLVADEEKVRSNAARALGLIGDPRAIEPLSDVLVDDADTVRASAAWALVAIGTRPALETAAQYVDDRSYLVESEAERAADALAEDEPAATA